MVIIRIVSELFVFAVVARAHSELHGMDGLRVPGMNLAVLTVLIIPLRFQEGRGFFESPFVFHERFLGDLFQTDPVDARFRASEMPVDHLTADPNGLKCLGTVITAERGNAELRQHLEQALVNGLDVVFLSLKVVRDPIEAVFLEEIKDGGKSPIGIDGTGPITKQQGEVHDFPGFGGFHNECDFSTLANPDEMMMNA